MLNHDFKVNNEVEMKFVVNGDGHDKLQKVLPNLSHLLGEDIAVKVDYQRKILTNQYYDTEDNYFSKHRFGFRIRGCNGVYEQTLKTQGSTIGGLHQRGEYNVELSDAQPQLSLFSNITWPEEASSADLQTQLVKRFATDFTRDEYRLSIGDDCVEVVFDCGLVTTENNEHPINEVEIELKQGDVKRVFQVARILNQHLSLRLSDTTKAAVGYTLLGEARQGRRLLPDFLPLEHHISTEEAFCKAVACALDHWQYHEQLYMNTQALKYLENVNEGLYLLMQSVSLYLPVLQCGPLLTLHKRLISFAQKWTWLTELHNLRFLRSKKGPFTHFLTEHEALMSYLQGRKVGLLQGRSPEQLFFNSEANEIKILTSEIVYHKPWRQEATGYDKPLLEHARGWLSQGWQNVMQSLSQQEPLSQTHYIATEAILRQALSNGFLLADLFSDQRGEFRAPWQDILIGVEEMKALITLKKLLGDAEFEDIPALKSWTADKLHNLLLVIERTRAVAIEQEAYW
ncbi:inorganic triphosphatase [Alteromonas facilis]|uniref:CYTH domain-containing protein n=1 Tax=Alteromonas facilis TaxID=2048004 RepID=UPI000C28BC3D|nr:CYTH domain-containing protein [Alteromonas facilis]